MKNTIIITLALCAFCFVASAQPVEQPDKAKVIGPVETVASLKAQLADKDKQIADLNQKVAALTSQVQQMSDFVGQIGAQRNSIMDQLAATQAQLSRLQHSTFTAEPPKP